MAETNPAAQGIITISREVLQRDDPELLVQLEPLLNAAEDGNRKALDVFARAVAGPNGLQRDKLMLLLAGLASSAVTGIEPIRPSTAVVQPQGEVHLPVKFTLDEAVRRARHDEYDFVGKTPSEIEAEIFKGMEYARDEMLSGSPEFAFMEEDRELTVLDSARIVLADRVGRMAIDAFSGARAAGLEVPPNPASERYGETVVGLMGYRPEAFEEWQAWPHWKTVLAYQFVGIVAGVKEAGPSRDQIERMEAAIEAKREWYRSLSLFDIDDADVERALDRIYAKSSGFDDLRATAELRRFIKPGDTRLQENPNVAALMAAGIEQLHARDASLEFGRFVQLLPHFTYPMEFDGVMALLTSEGSRANRSQLYRAQTILAWHLEPGLAQLDTISHIVRETRGWFASIDKFCEAMLRLGPGDFIGKLESMAGAELYVEPLLAEIEDAYPGEIRIDVESIRSAMISPARDEDEADAPSPAAEAEGDSVEAAAAAAAEAEASAAGASAAAAAESAAADAQLSLSFSALGTSIKPR